jgi:hypothetical protein
MRAVTSAWKIIGIQQTTTSFYLNSLYIREYFTILSICRDRGSTVVKVLCYKSEGRLFEPSWCQWNFLLTQNPSDRTMALGTTQPLTEMSTGSISWG